MKKMNRGVVTSFATLAGASKPSECSDAAKILSYAGIKIGRRFTAAQLGRLHQAVATLLGVHGLVQKGLMEEVVGETGERGYRLTPRGLEIGMQRMANRKAA